MPKDKLLRGIYKRGKIYWVGIQVAGTRQYASLQTADLSLAIQRAAAYRRCGFNKNKNGKLSYWAKKFLSEKLLTGTYSRKSIEWSESAINIFIRFVGDIPPTHVNYNIGSEWFSDLRRRLSESAAQSYVRATRSFFSWMVQHHITYENPFTLFKLPRVAQPARLRFCDEALRDKLIDNAPNESLAFVLYAGFHSGLRKNEIVEARPEWFDLEAGLLHVDNTNTFTTKGRTNRTVPLTEEFKTFLKRYGLRSPFMLNPYRTQGSALYRYDFRRRFEGYMGRQGCPWVTPHIMRHTFASLLVSRGVSLFKVAKWLGDSPSVTEKYYAHLLAADPDIERGHRTLEI